MTTTTIIVITVCVLAVLIILPLLLKKRTAKASEGDSSEQIYVGNLPYRATERDLRRFFTRFGEIKNVRIIRDQATGRSRGFAFVTYSSDTQAEKALNAHGEDMYGRQMVVRIAKSR